MLSKAFLTWGLLTAPLIPQPIPLPEDKPIIITVGQSQWEKEHPWKDGKLTAYYNGKDEMNGELGITASGYNLDNGIYYRGYRILAGDKSIPLGTIVEIEEGGKRYDGVVLDRGGRIRGNRFDVVLRSYDDCISFGKRDIRYRIRGEIEI